MDSSRNRIVHGTARVVAVAVFVLLVVGALVTSTDSGLAVPDWPLAYGRVMPPMVGGILYEHGHRMVAALVSFFVGLQVGVLLWGERRRPVRRLGLLAFGAILAQALLGGLTVLLLLPPAVSSAHAALAQIVFALTASIALVTSRAWTSGDLPFGVGAADVPDLSRALLWTAVAAGAVYVQILLGAVMRHTGAGLAIPDFPLAFGRLLPGSGEFARPGVPIHFAHRIGAVVASGLVILAIRASLRLRARVPAAGTLAELWAAALALQVTLGTFSIWTRKAVPVTAAHVAVGALVWVLGVLLALTLGRARAAARAALAAAGESQAASPAPVPHPAFRTRVSDYMALTKPRITLFVVLTAFVGFAAGTSGRLSAMDLALLAHALAGTALVASGTSAFNQLSEIDLDARMRRTAGRPLPGGRVSPLGAFLFATSLSAAGIAELAFFVNGITALLAAATLVSYVCLYTPMKTVSPLSTIVGAVPGALPPLGGFTAVQGAIGPPGLVLFVLLFLWQLPHFFAIGWRHRADYGAAGVRILPTIDPTGRRTSRHALGWCLALLPASLLPSVFGMAGSVYAVGALALTLLFLAASFRFARETTDERALGLFLASIGWLPAVLLLLVLDRVPF
ncbi:MAG TPA: heme o synthase [Thermoanaerobaculia bacterium]|nr:heme o synthase [Thermoanaerobaculia bacterium]